MRLRIVLAIARKDILDAVRNATILFTLIMPIGISLLLRVMIPRYGGEGFLEIAVYDAGRSRLVERLQDNLSIKIIPVQGADEVVQKVKEGAWGGLVLPENFDRGMEAGQVPVLQVYYDGQKGLNQRSLLQEVLEDALRSMAGQDLPARLVSVDISAPEKERVRPEFDLGRFYLILFLVMGLSMVGGFVVPTLLVEEKEKQTLQAILVSPAGYVDVMVGKALVGIFYALLSALFLLLLNGGFSGNIGITVLSTVLGALFLVLLGLFLGAISNSTSQVNVWSSLVLLALMLPAMLNLPPYPPEPIYTLVKLIPTYYIADAITLGLSGNANLNNVGLDLAVLAFSTFLSAGAVVWALRRGRR